MPWARHNVTDRQKGQHHDQLTGDFLGEGRVQVVSWFQGGGELSLFRVPQDPRQNDPWPTITVASGVKQAEGLASGDIDASTAPELERRLMRAFDPRVTEVVVDFSPASLVESTTLGVLVETKRRLSARRIPLKLVCSDPRVAKVFTITGFDRLFEIYASREQALPGHLMASAPR